MCGPNPDEWIRLSQRQMVGQHFIDEETEIQRKGGTWPELRTACIRVETDPKSNSAAVVPHSHLLVLLCYHV